MMKLKEVLEINGGQLDMMSTDELKEAIKRMQSSFYHRIQRIEKTGLFSQSVENLNGQKSLTIANKNHDELKIEFIKGQMFLNSPDSKLAYVRKQHEKISELFQKYGITKRIDANIWRSAREYAEAHPAFIHGSDDVSKIHEKIIEERHSGGRKKTYETILQSIDDELRAKYEEANRIYIQHLKDIHASFDF